MQKYQSHLKTISSLASQIRIKQRENGFSEGEVQGYVSQLVRGCFAGQGNGAGDVEGLLRGCLGQGAARVEDVLARVIQCFEIEVFALSYQPTIIDQPSQPAPQAPPKSPQPNPQQKKPSFHIATESNPIPSPNASSFTTPKHKAQKKIREYFKESPSANQSTRESKEVLNLDFHLPEFRDIASPAQVNGDGDDGQIEGQGQGKGNDFDLIEQSIQETLERTRKLRMYLNMKTKEDKEKRLRFQSRLQNLEQIFDQS